MIIRTYILIYYWFNTHSSFRQLTTYYALDKPHPAYDYDSVGNVPAYDGYIEDGHGFDGYTNTANIRGSCYDEDYVCAS